MAHKYLGEILIDEGVLSPDDLEKALKAQKKQLGEILVDMGALAPEDLEKALEVQARGRTRAQIYARYLRIALAALAVVTVAACLALVSILQDMRFEEELEGGTLPVTRILGILEASSSSQGVRLDALRSVDALPEEERVVVLRRALEDPSWSVRVFAVGRVRAHGLESTVVNLVPLLLDPEDLVREEAHRALRELTGEDLPLEFREWYSWAKGEGMEPVQPERLKETSP